MEKPVKTFVKSLCWLSLFITVSGLKLTLNQNEQLPPCNNGLRLNKDNFLFRGTLDATGVYLKSAARVLYLKRWEDSSVGKSKQICGINISSPCSSVPRYGCYCSSKAGQTYQLVFNLTALAIHRNVDVYIEWATAASNVQKMPPLYDENGAVVMLIVNGQSFAGRLSGKCDFILIAKRKNFLELQVRNTATPCHLRMSLTSSGSTIFSDRTGNAKLTFTPPDDLDTVKVEISYSMCNQNNYIPCGSCMAFTMCSPKKYGRYCNLDCSDLCVSNSSYRRICSSVDGACLHGCVAGHKGWRCRDLCGINMWGERCSSECSPNCNLPDDLSISRCDNVNGKCLFGCKSGYMNLQCTEECQNGTYGHGCSSMCNYCEGFNNTGMSPCNINGICKFGCANGIKLPQCQQESATEHDDTLVIAAVICLAFGAVIVAALNVVVVICMRKYTDTSYESSNVRHTYVPPEIRLSDTLPGSGLEALRKHLPRIQISHEDENRDHQKRHSDGNIDHQKRQSAESKEYQKRQSHVNKDYQKKYSDGYKEYQKRQSAESKESEKRQSHVNKEYQKRQSHVNREYEKRQSAESKESEKRQSHVNKEYQKKHSDGYKEYQKRQSHVNREYQEKQSDGNKEYQKKPSDETQTVRLSKNMVENKNENKNISNNNYN